MIAFEVDVDSGELAVRDALTLVLSNLEVLSLDVEELATVELVLAEALNNVVEHAYPKSEPGNPIHIQCSQKATGLHFAITDQGHAMPDGKTPLGLSQNVDVDPLDMPEGGFGWFLIKDLAKDVLYRRIENENQLSLRIAVAIP
ncbi:MAG: ATP-binding protein [Sulfitobacter sp.]